MEAEINDSKSGRNKTKILILLIISSVFIIYFCIMSMLSPARKLKEIKDKYGIKQAGNNIVDEKILTDSTYLKLLKEKTFLQSRTTLAETDSIYLTLNLADSTANLEISGVVVHLSKIKRFRTSKILSKSNDNSIVAMLSLPLTIKNDRSTIRKEPLMIKVAPKDTSEYKPDILPDTAGVAPVNYILEMDKGLRIYIYQEEKEKFGDRMNLFRFDLGDRFRNTWSSLKSIILFKVPEYHPYIKIRLSRADAKILYRAIPRYGQVAVYR
jgi:hypothetical protein